VQGIDTVQPSSARGLGPVLALVALGMLVAVSTTIFGPLAALPIFGLLFVGLVVARPEYGIALFLSTFLMTYPQSLQGTGFLTINNALGGIFLILLTYKVYREEDWWFLRCPELHLLVFILLMFYLSDRFNGPDPRMLPLLGVQEHGAENLRTFLTRTAFVVFFINYIRAPEHVRMIFLLAIAFMVVTALTGIQGVLHGGGLYGYRATSQAAVIASAFNPNRLAMFAILAIAGLYYLMQSLRIPGLPLLIIPTIAVLALAVFMTASRSGLLGLGVCGAAIVLDEGLDLRKILTFGLAALLVGSLLIQFVPEKTIERITNLPFTEGGQEGLGSSSFERRQYTWEVAVDLFRENPVLGVGIGNWELARFLKDPTHSTGAPHSSYLLALCEGGVFCLAGFLVLLWRTWRNLRAVEPYVSDPNFPLADLRWIVKSAKVSFIVLIFFSLFADLWQLVIIYWLVGLSIVMRRLVEQASIEEALAY
jgi:O-antigen ligase